VIHPRCWLFALWIKGLDGKVMRGAVFGTSPPLVVDSGNGHMLVPKQFLHLSNILADI